MAKPKPFLSSSPVAPPAKPKRDAAKVRQISVNILPTEYKYLYETASKLGCNPGVIVGIALGALEQVSRDPSQIGTLLSRRMNAQTTAQNLGDPAPRSG